MGRKSRWDEKFQREAVRLAETSGSPRYKIAADLGVADPTLARWMTKYSVKNDDSVPLSETERAELIRLRSEVKKLKDRTCDLVMEREILKKATAFWVKESTE